MHRTLPLAGLALVIALAAYAVPVDRALVEDGADRLVDAGETSGGRTLVVGQGPQTRVRPTTCAGGVCGRAFPDAGNEGLLVSDITGWSFAILGPYDQTLTGTGSCELDRMDIGLQTWTPVEGKTLTVPASANGRRSVGWPVVTNNMQANGVRVLYRCTGVGVSGADGGSLITSLQACKSSTDNGCGTP